MAGFAGKVTLSVHWKGNCGDMRSFCQRRKGRRVVAGRRRWTCPVDVGESMLGGSEGVKEVECALTVRPLARKRARGGGGELR